LGDAGSAFYGSRKNPYFGSTMSKHETPMTRLYWQQAGGTLIEEFCAVPRSSNCGVRLIDGIIIKDEPHQIARRTKVSIEGKDIIVTQAKANRLGMNVMGQAFFSEQLMHTFKPRSIEPVALVLKDDVVLRPVFEGHAGMQVVIYPVLP